MDKKWGQEKSDCHRGRDREPVGQNAPRNMYCTQLQSNPLLHQFDGIKNFAPHGSSPGALKIHYA
jgi:hypothetical protein